MTSNESRNNGKNLLKLKIAKLKSVHLICERRQLMATSSQVLAMTVIAPLEPLT